jgi:uncharacterized protein YdiU (UPF0061 family)
VFSSIDHAGRYAYGNQARIAAWNLARFAETILPLLADDSEAAVSIANEAIGTFPGHFSTAIVSGLRRKLGLFTKREGDAELGQAFLDAMGTGRADFTLAFRRLCAVAESADAEAEMRALFEDAAAWDAWAARWRQRLAEEPEHAAHRAAAMRSVNPVYIPRNHLVEAALAAATERGDYAPFTEMLEVLSHPYEEQPRFASYAEPPPPDQGTYRTFCGT